MPRARRSAASPGAAMLAMLPAAVLLGNLALTAPARAQAATPPAAPKSWSDSISISGYFQAGITAAPGIKNPRINFGHVFTDKANEVLVNQAALTIARPLDKDATGYDVGFKLQGMIGSDARYTRALGIFDRMIGGRYQFDVVEANVLLHAPWFTDGGIDFKFGLFTTPLGLETIDPTTNPFYTHSYIFNFGLPLKHTGALAAIHLIPEVDLYVGVTTGVNTTFGKNGDNNSAVAGIAGFGLNLLDGKLTVLALSHFGPENPQRLVGNASRHYRIFNDVLITYKPTEKLTLTTEFNYVREQLVKANGYGAAQYVGYAVTDSLTLNARGEVWRDEKNFFVAAFPGFHDFVNAQLGRPATIIAAPKPTTYGALTLGVTYKPGLSGVLSGLMIRPELRYDHTLNGTRAFNGGRSRGAFTLASDIVLSF